MVTDRGATGTSQGTDPTSRRDGREEPTGSWYYDGEG